MASPFQVIQQAKTMGTTQSYLLFAILFLLILLKQYFFGRRELNLPPGPSKLPLIGNLHEVGKMPHLSFHQISQKFGPIIHLQLGEIATVVVSSARTAKEVLKTHDLVLASRPQIFSAKHLFYNCTDMAFSPYGSYWRHIRKICILELLSAKRVESFSFIRKEEVARMVNRIAEPFPNTVNLSRILALYANEIVCRATFGRGFIEGGEYDKHGFHDMLDEYQELLGGLSLGDFFPSMEWIFTITGMRSRLEKTFRRFDCFFNEVIEEHLNSKKKKGDHQDLVDVLLEAKEKDAGDLPLTMDNIKAIILDMFAAGTDTNFIALEWGMTELVMNPRIMKRAQAEVRSIVGDRRIVSEENLPHMKYLKAVIKEIFRLHPSVPVLLPRESVEEVTIDGYVIPAKTRFFVNVWAIGRDPELWNNPEMFEPERFMESNIDFKGQDYELLPFGAGRRICPGIALASVSVELALAQLLYSFDWELPPGIQFKDLDLTEVFGITTHKISDLIVVAKPYIP